MPRPILIRWSSLPALAAALLLLAPAPRAGGDGGGVATAAELAHAVPRNAQFSRVTSAQGLSSEFVQDVIQDAAGYLWFATQSGLSRYDGHEVRVYEHRADDPTSLSHNFVWSLHVDPAGRLLIGTDRGVNVYQPASDDFATAPFGREVAQLRIRDIATDGRGDTWLGTRDSGLVRVDRATGAVTTYRPRPGEAGTLPGLQISELFVDRGGTLWIGTDAGGLARHDPDADRFVVYRASEDGAANNDDVLAIGEDAAGMLWVGTESGGLSRLDPQTGVFKHYRYDEADPLSLPAGQVRSLLRDADGTLWVGTEAGLAEWRPALGGFVRYVNDPADERSLADDRVNAMYQDASGVLWLATQGGVSSWNYLSDTFTYFSAAQGYLESDVVSALAESPDGTLWIGTYGGGLSRMAPDGVDLRHFRHDPADPTSLSDDRVMAVHVDGAGRVWVGTRSGGLSRLEPDGRFSHFRHDPADPDSIGGNAISCIYSDEAGELWVGVYGVGLDRVRVEGNTLEVTRYRHDPADPDSLGDTRLLTIVEDARGDLLIGTRSAGLNRFHRDEGRFERIDIDSARGRGGADPVDGTPWVLQPAADGSLWIGTLSGGLLRWRAEDLRAGRARFERYDSAAGLPSDVYGIVQGGEGELWLSSSRGIFRFEPGAGAVRRFDRTNGLRDNEFNMGAALGTRSGRILFGGTGGLLAFDPSDLPFNAHAPGIALTASSRSEVLARLTTGEAAPAMLRLGYRDPFIVFDFVALDFVSPDKNRYQFRLWGYDGEWNDAGTLRRALYSNLPAGSYRFEVRAANSSGVWNAEETSLDLTVAPPPWRSRWAYLGYLCLTLALALGWMKRQADLRRREVETRERLERLVRQRTVELADRNEELTRLNQRLKEASVTDELTGLRNRRFVDQYIEGEMRAVRRHHAEREQSLRSGEPERLSMQLCVLMIDLDGFKAINDRFGHHAGDLALVEVRERLQRCCRASDVVVRWGGDEFLVFGRVNSFRGAQVLAEEIRKVLAEQPYDVGEGQRGVLSGSIGVTVVPFTDNRAVFCTWEQAVATADHAAYLAKYNGRNAWVSIRGTDRFEPGDTAELTQSVQKLTDAGKLRIESSLSSQLHLQIHSLDASGLHVYSR